MKRDNEKGSYCMYSGPYVPKFYGSLHPGLGSESDSLSVPGPYVSQMNMVDNDTMIKGPTVCIQDPPFPSFRVPCYQG